MINSCNNNTKLAFCLLKFIFMSSLSQQKIKTHVFFSKLKRCFTKQSVTSTQPRFNLQELLDDCVKKVYNFSKAFFAESLRRPWRVIFSPSLNFLLYWSVSHFFESHVDGAGHLRYLANFHRKNVVNSATFAHVAIY